MSKNQQSKNRPKKILAISSSGGHWVQLLRVIPAFKGRCVVYVSVNRQYETEVKNSRFYTVVDVTRWDKAKWCIVASQLIWILLRERPDVVISTGALPGFICIVLAKIMRKRTIWIDSIANVEEMSMSGRRIRKYVDLWLTQWPHLSEEKGPEYAGQVL